MTTKTPWLKPNGKPLDDSRLKKATRSWNMATWNAYLDWYEKPRRESLLREGVYERICEESSRTLFEDHGHSVDVGLRNFCERQLRSLSKLEAKVLRLLYFEGLTELEAASQTRTTQKAVNKIKWRAISKLSARNSEAEVLALRIMRGLDLENEVEQPSPWNDPTPLSLRQNRPYLPDNWKFELETIAHSPTRKAIQRLPDGAKRIIYLRFWCDYSTSAIARELDIGVNSVDEICDASVFKIKSYVVSETQSQSGVNS